MLQRCRAFTLLELLVVMAIIGLAIALLLPATRQAREPARRSQCSNNLRQIGLALLNYHDTHGALPPAYTEGADGNRLHSWRTLLLPYMEHPELYGRIDLDVPWDDPSHTEFQTLHIPNYTCPSTMHDDGQTTYLGVVGPEFAFTGATSHKTSDVSDGPQHTIVVIDAFAGDAAPWMAPRDADEPLVLAAGDDSRTNHPGVILALFLDGHTEILLADQDREQRRAMLTIAGCEPIAD
ncbi:MAG: DUF1559 domain-containing protein [Planctomycetales bacterium]|nr:DUF1559 domain-containing protein [Planctomycetales bacterium]